MLDISLPIDNKFIEAGKSMNMLLAIFWSPVFTPIVIVTKF